MDKSKIFKFIGIIIISSFIFLIIASKSGYYEYELSNKTNLTNEAIKKFEEDVEKGKSIDINDYLDNKSKDYNNKISNMGNKISNSIEGVLSKGFSYIFKYLNKHIS